MRFVVAEEFIYAKTVIRRRMANGSTLNQACSYYRDVLGCIIASGLVHGSQPTSEILREFEWLDWVLSW